MESFKWWIKIILIGIFSLYVSILSALNLGSAYKLKNPFEFVMTFFSQSLMLMISIVAIIYSFFQVYYYFQKEKEE